jgi:hypothetical protein
LRPTLHQVRWAGERYILLLIVAARLAAADPPLFPTPLHIVRSIEDPLASATVRVDEYCTGNTIVTVNGRRTAIVDYDRQEVIEIDRAGSTYSVAKFDEIARAQATFAPASPKTGSWTTTPLGVRAASDGRVADAFEIVGSSPEKVKVDLRVDRERSVSRKALEALVGSAYPNRASEQQNAVARACARSRVASVAETSASDSYGIPLDQAITFEAGSGRTLTLRNSVISVTNDLPPPEVMAIPAGARLVESRSARMEKSLKDLKELPAPHP